MTRILLRALLSCEGAGSDNGGDNDGTDSEFRTIRLADDC